MKPRAMGMYVRSLHPLTGRRRHSFRRVGDLVRSVDDQIAQQVGIDLVPCCSLAGSGLLVDRLQAKHAHQAANLIAAHRITLLAKPNHHLARAVKRRLQIQLVDPVHQFQRRCTRHLGLEHFRDRLNRFVYLGCYVRA